MLEGYCAGPILWLSGSDNIYFTTVYAIWALGNFYHLNPMFSRAHMLQALSLERSYWEVMEHF
jgi:hypothetical protein